MVYDEPDRNDTAHSGVVKWYDTGRGFGFIAADDGGPDILLHQNVLNAFGQNTVADGARISVRMKATPRGRQALSILDITRDAAPPAPLREFERLSQDDMNDLPMQAARVKWFNKAEGFGFANVFGRAEDVFLHIEVLNRSGLKTLEPGEAVALRVVPGSRGPMAAQILPWEMAQGQPAASAILIVQDAG